jgi:hypothetical protein
MMGQKVRSNLFRYFDSKIGDQLHKRVVTGQTFFTQVYARQYTAEVIAAEHNSVHIYLAWYNITPSGYVCGGSQHDHGDILVDLEKVHSINDFWKEVIRIADPSMQQYL